MNAIKRRGVLVALALFLSWSCLHAGEGSRCDLCGCGNGLHRVCVPKRIEKEVTKICWDVKCEDICIPGRSTACGTTYQQDACGCWSFIHWEPHCAKVKTRRTAVKTEVKRKVPAVQWVVEYRCDACRRLAGQAAPAAQPGPDAAPPPAK